MTDRSPFAHERLLELLADQSLIGLEPHEEADLANLLREYPGEDPASFARAAAALDTGLMRGKIEPMPAHVAARVEAAIAAAAGSVSGPGVPRTASVASAAPVVPIRSSRRATIIAASGWMAAAACFALAIGAFALRDRATPTETPSAEAARAQLLSRGGAAAVAWSATKDPAASGVTGDVVFSVTEQKGYMRFRGLAANDKTKLQYQLWIFDKTQDERFPVDGGVFDVDQATGDVIVPIQAKLRVNEPTLFAVTIEKPGGVVVSKRERIVVTASTRT